MAIVKGNIKKDSFPLFTKKKVTQSSFPAKIEKANDLLRRAAISKKASSVSR